MPRHAADTAALTIDAYVASTLYGAGAIALYLRWCGRTGRDWRTAATDVGLFITWLRHAPKEVSGPDPALYGGELLVGPGRAPVRGVRQINLIQAAIRAFLMHSVTAGEAPAEMSTDAAHGC